MMKLILVVALLGLVYADNTQKILDHFQKVLDGIDGIPADRMAKYKVGIENARPCISAIADEATPERIESYIDKVTPIALECGASIKGIEDLKERKEKFSACLKEKVHGTDSTLDDKQKETLPKVKECVLKALE